MEIVCRTSDWECRERPRQDAQMPMECVSESAAKEGLSCLLIQLVRRVVESYRITYDEGAQIVKLELGRLL